MPTARDSDVTRIAVLDDQPLFVDGVAMALDGSGDLVLVLRATTTEQLMASLQRTHANVLVVEPWGRSDDGLDGVAAVRDGHPGMAIVALSHETGEAQVKQLVALGAQAYVSKSTRSADLPPIIRHVAAGATMLPPAAHRHPGADLTPREAEVLALAARGMSNAALGRQLFVTERTVKFHLHNAFRKLGARNRTEAAHTALGLGLIRWEESPAAA